MKHLYHYVISYRQPLLFLIFLSTFYVPVKRANAQHQMPVDRNTWKPSMPATPIAASIQKYGDIPVDYYTGVPKIDIPLYEINVKGIKIPVSISYAASGIRVQEEASWVGLGWSLNCGGVITRARRMGDDLSGDAYKTVISTTLADFIARGGGDTEPDLFTFNFLGYSGKFIIERPTAQNPNFYFRFLSPQDMKLELTPEKNWKITTNDGTVFLFAEKETKRDATLSIQVIPTRVDLPPLPNVSYVSSWYLSSITTIRNETITFNYTASTSEISSDFNVTHERVLYDYSAIMQQACYVNNKSKFPDIVDTYTSAHSAARHVYPVSINYPGGRVTFNTSDRSDLLLLGSGTAKKLDEILIESRNGTAYTPLKKMQFGYDYFNTLSGAADYYTKRLKLLTVTETDNGVALPPYRFNYNITQLPDKNTYGFDLWGYYNGANNASILASLGNRQPNPAYMRAAMLQEIQYPAGGTTVFAYEPHDYSNFDLSQMGDNPPANTYGRIGGGVRVAEITDFNGITTSIRRFIYRKLVNNLEVSSGKRTAGFRGSYTISNLYPTTFSPNLTDCYNYNVTLRYFLSSASSSAVLTSDAPAIGYDKVTVLHGEFGENGKTEYEYNNNMNVIAPIAIGMPMYIPALSKALTRETSFKKTGTTFTPVKSTQYNYTSVLLNAVPGYKYVDLKNEFTVYYTRCEWVKLDATIERGYTLNNPQEEFKKETLLEYNATGHMQPVISTSINNAGIRVIKKMKYPGDYPATSSPMPPLISKPAVRNMLERNIIRNPIEVTIYRKHPGEAEKVIGSNLSRFNLDPSSNLLLPAAFYTLELDRPLDNFTTSSITLHSNGAGQYFEQMNYDVRYRDAEFFDQFDSYGNVLQQHTKDGMLHAYLWGYNNQYLVARIDGTSYNEAIAHVNSAILQNPTSDEQLRTELNKLRTAFPGKVLVVTYTYLPSVGVTSITGPEGRMTTYEYDNVGRLKQIRDHNGYIMSRFCYSYAGKPVDCNQIP